MLTIDVLWEPGRSWASKTQEIQWIHKVFSAVMKNGWSGYRITGSYPWMDGREMTSGTRNVGQVVIDLEKNINKASYAVVFFWDHLPLPKCRRIL